MNALLVSLLGAVLAQEPAPPAPIHIAPAPVRIGGAIRAPKLVERSHRRLPDAPFRAGLSGAVDLEATVGVDGRVVDVRLLPGSAVPFAASAVDDVKRWRYAPLVLEGVATPFVIEVKLSFSTGGPGPLRRDPKAVRELLRSPDAEVRSYMAQDLAQHVESLSRKEAEQFAEILRPLVAQEQDEQAKTDFSQTLQALETRQVSGLKEGGSSLADAVRLVRYGRNQDAVAKLKALDEAAGGNCAECLLVLAAAYRGLGKPADSLAQARLTLQKTQDASVLAQAYALIGEALASGDYKKPDAETRARLEEADAAFSKVLELTTGRPVTRAAGEMHENAHANRVALMLKLGRRAEAEDLAAPILQHAPDSPLAQRIQRLLSEPRCLREACAPSFSYTSATGEVRTLEDLRGKVVLLSFWFPGDLRQQAVDAVREIGEHFANDSLVVIGITADTDETREAIGKYRITWPQAFDSGKELAKLYKVHAWPAEIVIDHEGVITMRRAGAITWHLLAGRVLPYRDMGPVRAAVQAALKRAKKAPAAPDSLR
jgi:TonB family protein